VLENELGLEAEPMLGSPGSSRRWKLGDRKCCGGASLAFSGELASMESSGMGIVFYTGKNTNRYVSLSGGKLCNIC
jgi:hypothetical protein